MASTEGGASGGGASRDAAKIIRQTIQRFRANQAARWEVITRAIHAPCSGLRRSAYGVQPRLRSAIDTAAALALSGTVKPALRRPLGVSTSTRRRRSDIRITKANDRPLSAMELVSIRFQEGLLQCRTQDQICCSDRLNPPTQADKGGFLARAGLSANDPSG